MTEKTTTHSSRNYDNKHEYTEHDMGNSKQVSSYTITGQSV